MGTRVEMLGRTSRSVVGIYVIFMEVKSKIYKSSLLRVWRPTSNRGTELLNTVILQQSNAACRLD